MLFVKFFKLMICLVVVMLMPTNSLAEHYYSSLKDLKTLVDVQNKYIASLERFIDEELNFLEAYERKLNDQDIDKNVLLSFIEDHTENSESGNLFGLQKMAPKENIDLAGASRAISRLQETYNISLSHLSTSGLGLDAKDILEVGLMLFKEKNYDKSIDWLMFLLDNQDQYSKRNLTLMQINSALQHLHQSFYQVGESEEALQVVEMMLKFEKYGSILKYIISDINDTERNELNDLKSLYEENEKEYVPSSQNQMLMPPDLCSGKYKYNSKLQKELHCFYDYMDIPFYIIGPYKKEQIYKNPDIFLYHNFLSDKEADHLIQVGLNNSLEMSTILSNNKFVSASTYRSSKVLWLDYEENEFNRKMEKRVKSVMGKSREYFEYELLQLANYGLGGHYNRHLDSKTEDLYEVDNNRISTLLVYLTDVEIGGSTVFTELGIGVKPQKGLAVKWDSYDENGILNKNTNHAACPVLYGEKWGLNVWVIPSTALLQCPANIS